MTEATAIAPTANDKILCHIDNVMVHTIQGHIKANHSPEWTLERYRSEFPDEPILSPYAQSIVKRREAEEAEKKAAEQSKTSEPSMVAGLVKSHDMFHEIFELGEVPAAMSGAGTPIKIDVLSGHVGDAKNYLPDVDGGYVFNIDLLKKVVIGLQFNMPTYLWGYHGTGKTTILQQAAARTGRPFIRVQHSLNMQESDVLGQWTVKDGSTEFQLGPLPMAMINGWVYCADEYDMAMPNVTTLYQPVMEGQSLLIKDAPPEYRKITPHPDFRFCGTGNTNGVGDESGLYQGALMQNAANYSRFKITEEVKYMEEAIEVSILQSRAKVRKQDATKIVKFGNKVRESFADGNLSMTVSPRELIAAAELGIIFSAKWDVGIELAFANRLSRVDRRTVKEFIQRAFGGSSE